MKPRIALALAVALTASPMTYAMAAGTRAIPPRTESHSYTGSTPTGAGGLTVENAPGGTIYISVVAFALRAKDQYATAKVVDKHGLTVGGNVYFAASTNTPIGPIKPFCGATPKLAVPRGATQYVVQVKADACSAPAAAGTVTATFQQVQAKPRR